MDIDPRNAANTTVAGGKELAEAPQSEVPHALSRLEMANAHLHEVVGVLHERLAPVRNEHAEQSGQSDRAVRGYGSEVARRIGTEADSAEMASDVIIKILNELEV